MSPKDFAFTDMPPPSPKLHKRGSESYFEIIQKIMHGFGDFTMEQNEKTAKLIEDYLITHWLPIFRNNG